MTASNGQHRPALLAIDTATSRVVIALAGARRRHGELPPGEPPLGEPPLGESSWVAGQHHGETLMPALDRLLGETGVRRSDLTAVVVGTGPGTFTGLRVGISTAKGLAHGLRIPIIGVSTAAALLAGMDAIQAEGTAGPTQALLLPAGPQDRVLVQDGIAQLLPAGSDPDLEPGTTLVAVDLDGRAPPDAVSRGERALSGLGPALLRLGAARLASHGGDDLARLVPDYVTLPRGIRREAGEVSWSRDRR
jgi:tRNA threonylcarbamoyladenosine biosynthesis protein TsaB